MKSVIVFLFFSYLVFTQAQAQTTKAQQIPQSLTAETTQSPPSTAKKGSNDYWNRQVRNNMKGKQDLTDEQIEEIAQIVSMTVCAALIVSVIIGGILLFKCMQKRRASQDLKSQMLAKKQLYASRLGINLYELNNDPRMTFTMHI